MSRITLLATALAVAVAAGVAASPADARQKGSFYFLKNGTMSSFRAYKLLHNPPLYVALHKMFGLGPQWGLAMNTPVPSGSDPAAAAQSRSDYCGYGSWGR